MSIELGQKVLNLQEIHEVAVKGCNIKVGRPLLNDLSDAVPKKIKAKETDLLDMKVSQRLRKTEYLRAFALITLSNLARMKKAGRKQIVELITILINRKVLPKGITDAESNIIDCLVKAISKDGEVIHEGELKKFTEVIDLPDEEEEEEEKKEPPCPLDKLTPQELFLINSKRNFQLAITSVETNRLEVLIKKLFTSFGMSAQALNISADGFHTLAITQGLDNKTAQIVKNSFLALVDKSQELGKKADPSSEEQIMSISHLMISVLQANTHLSNIVSAEVNSEVWDLFSDKKADAVQGFIDRVHTSFEYLIKSLNELLVNLTEIKLRTLESLKDESKDLITEYEGIRICQCEEYEKLVALMDVLEKICTKEEFLSYTILKERDRE